MDGFEARQQRLQPALDSLLLKNFAKPQNLAERIAQIMANPAQAPRPRRAARLSRVSRLPRVTDVFFHVRGWVARPAERQPHAVGVAEGGGLPSKRSILANKRLKSIGLVS